MMTLEELVFYTLKIDSSDFTGHYLAMLTAINAKKITEYQDHVEELEKYEEDSCYYDIFCEEYEEDQLICDLNKKIYSILIEENKKNEYIVSYFENSIKKFRSPSDEYLNIDANYRKFLCDWIHKISLEDMFLYHKCKKSIGGFLPEACLKFLKIEDHGKTMLEILSEMIVNKGYVKKRMQRLNTISALKDPVNRTVDWGNLYGNCFNSITTSSYYSTLDREDQSGNALRCVNAVFNYLMPEDIITADDLYIPLCLLLAPDVLKNLDKKYYFFLLGEMKNELKSMGIHIIGSDTKKTEKLKITTEKRNFKKISKRKINHDNDSCTDSENNKKIALENQGSADGLLPLGAKVIDEKNLVLPNNYLKNVFHDHNYIFDSIICFESHDCEVSQVKEMAKK